MAKKGDKEKSTKGTGKDQHDTSTLESLLEGQIGSLIDGVKGLSSQAVKFAAEKTLDTATKAIKNSPEQLERMGRAGKSLKDLREVSGLTIAELASILDLKNGNELESAEEGKTALSLEIILRLASFHARNDPLPFIIKYARTYSPRVSELLEKLGLDKVVVAAEREIKFLKIYRSRDAARKLSDEGYEKVHAFTEQAFDMALHFVAEQENIEVDQSTDSEPADKGSEEE